MQVHRQHAGDPGPFLLQWVRDEVGTQVHALHRLDKPTAGLIAFASTSEEAARLSLAFRERRVSKRYLAIVRGHLPETGVIDYALGPVRDRKAPAREGKQDAITRYRTLAKSELPEAVGRYATARYSLLELSPETGRRHQLRRHLKHVFHPILGDRKYGDRDHNAFAQRTGFGRLALVSVHLSIDLGSERLALDAKPDTGFQEMAAAFGLPASQNEVDG